MGEEDKLMQWAMMWLNLYGHQAVWHKLKKGVKTQKLHFYPFFWAYGQQFQRKMKMLIQKLFVPIALPNIFLKVSFCSEIAEDFFI